jgi:pyruvate-formate lyase-activating enzyme
MHMNIAYINMCKLKKNREWRKELEKEREREVGGDGVCGCSFGEPLKQQTFQTSLYIQTRA